MSAVVSTHAPISETWTFFEGEWHEGNVAIMGPRTHAAWLGSMLFDGARAFEGTTPDLDRPVQASVKAHSSKRRDITVLVVEDEDGVREFAIEALAELGYDVVAADGPRAALELLDAHPEASVLLTDVVMPETNGRLLADEALRRRLRARREPR